MSQKHSKGFSEGFSHYMPCLYCTSAGFHKQNPVPERWSAVCYLIRETQKRRWCVYLTGDKSNKAVITQNTRPALCFPWKSRRRMSSLFTDSPDSILNSRHHSSRTPGINRFRFMKTLLNIFKQKTIFAKVIIIWCYQVIFSGFGEFHQKELSSVHPFLQLCISMCQFTKLFLCAGVLEEPGGMEANPLGTTVNRYRDLSGVTH